MKIAVVTGATSFIGIKLISKLLQNGYQVHAIIRQDSLNRTKLPVNPDLNVIECDMTNFNDLSNKINTSCNSFFHLAWDGTLTTARYDCEVQENNIRYSMEAVKIAASLGCNTFISAGSQAEYGLHREIITEKTECNPITAYGKAKHKFFNEAYEFCVKTNIRFIEPRFFSIYGPGDHEKAMIISTIRKMLKNEDCPFTEATQFWDFLYIDDATDAILKLIETDSTNGVFNLANGTSRTLRKYIEEMHSICNSQSRLLFGQVPYTAAGKVNLWADVSKLNNDTGWTPKTSFKTGIMKVISYCKRTEEK